jgi:RNA ligase (TIGR02306 family)
MEENTIEFRVPVTKVLEVIKHPNADKLSIYRVFGFHVVGGLNQYTIGDTVVYIPVDSILPKNIEEALFGVDSKIKLNKSRVRQIRIRQFPSQGMIFSPTKFPNLLKRIEEDQNVAEILGITKYEPPATYYNSSEYNGPKLRNKPKENPYFHKYGGIDNFKWYPDLFQEGQEVVFEEKIHGSNFRASILPYVPTSFWDKVKRFFKLLPKYEFCYGSNNVQLQKRPGNKGYYGEDIYGNIAKKYDIQNKLKPNETVYGEIYGPGIQKNYSYGVTEHNLVIFDVKILAEDKKSTQWLKFDELEKWCKERDLPLVPVLYRGTYTKDLAKQYSMGPTSMLNGTETREGIVIRDPNETSCYMGKKWLKLISELYLDDDTNTDNH